MKGWFSDSYISALNAQDSAGLLVKAAILVVSPSLTVYYVDNQESITFDGNTYVPMPMAWDAVGQSSQGGLPAIRVSVANVDGAVGSFLETTNLLGADVTLQLLHLALLGTITDVDAVRLQLMVYEWNDASASFTLGLNLALSEQLPRHVMTRAEYPGTPDTFRRGSIL